MLDSRDKNLSLFDPKGFPILKSTLFHIFSYFKHTRVNSIGSRLVILKAKCCTKYFTAVCHFFCYNAIIFFKIKAFAFWIKIKLF